MKENPTIPSWLPDELTIRDIVRYWAGNDRIYADTLTGDIRDACKKGELPCEGDPIPGRRPVYAWNWVLKKSYIQRYLYTDGLDAKIKKNDFKQWLIKVEAWPLSLETELAVWFRGNSKLDRPLRQDEVTSRYDDLNGDGPIEAIPDLKENRLVLVANDSPQHYKETLRLKFYRSGDYWTIGKEDRERSFRELKGFGYIAQLLECPRQPISSMDLHQHFGAPGISKEQYDEDMSIDSGIYRDTRPDNSAIMQIERKLREIEKALTGDYNFTDNERQKFIEEEKELRSYLRRTHRSGRTETARKGVKKAITTAMKQVLTECPELKPYLRIETGTNCTYIPPDDTLVEWITNPPTA